MTQQMERLPNWLRQALMIGQIPNQFADDHVQPVLDVGQGGWGGSDVRYFDETAVGVNAGSTVVTNTVNEAALILGARGITSAAFLVQIVIIPPTASGIVLGNHTMAAAGYATWKDLTGGAGTRIYVPPGCSFRISSTAPGAGDTLQSIGYYLKLPPGYNPF